MPSGKEVFDLKILHTGDVHLDTPFSDLDPERSLEMRRELRRTFSAMMKYAADTAVDMVLIAGDLFDNELVTRETVALLRRDFSALSCPVVISPGNHDCAGPSSVWARELMPANVCVFTDTELNYFPFDDLGVDVYGFAFTSKFMPSCPIGGLRVQDPDRINILLAHGDTTSPISQSCPMPPAMLRGFGADWCALGHIHNPAAANAVLEGIGAYCGCPMGRDFGECGDKNATLINIEKDADGVHVSTEALSFAKYAFRTCDVDCTGLFDTAAVCDAAASAVRGYGFGAGDLVRVDLCGSIDPSVRIDTDFVAEKLRFLKYAQVRDKTSPTWNAESLLADKGIRGEVYRVLLPKLESGDEGERETAAQALRYALSALAGEL